MSSTIEVIERTDIEVGELRDRLERHDPITILDVRSRADRDEWWIPGSVHVDVFQALKAGDSHALDHVNLSPESEVVTVCGVGKAARFGADQLRARGIPARVLVGGMKAWSLAWNTADVSVPAGDASVIQVRRTGKGCLSYLVGSGGEAAVIDASVEPEVYVGLAAERGWTIRHVLDTHVHADHISRSRELAELCGASFHLPATDRAAFPFQPLRDRDVFPIGDARLAALHSPGHTPEAMSYLLDGKALFTGDTLFLSTVGRPDLEASTGEARTRARLLWASLQRIMALGPETLVLPGHTSAPIPFDEKAIVATLADIRHQVQPLGWSADAFVETILSRLPPAPPSHAEIVALNEAGSTPEGDPTDLEAGANRCAVA